MIKNNLILICFITFSVNLKAQESEFLKSKILLMDSLSSKIFVLPYVGYNLYDKTQFGVCFYRNLMKENDGFNWLVAPAIQSQKKLVGNATFYYQKRLKNKIVFNIQYKIKSYQFDFIQFNHYLSQNINLNIQKVDSNSILGSRIIVAKNDIKNKQYSLLDTLGNPLFFNYPDYLSMYYLLSQTYFYKKINMFNLINGQFNIEFGSHFNTKIHDNIKTSLQFKWRYEFNKNKYFNSSFFAGVFLLPNNNSITSNFFRNNYGNTSDYQYKQTLIGRSENNFSGDNPWRRQLFDAENNSMRFSENKIYNNKWMISQNNDISLPGFIPFKLYFDWCYTQEMAQSNIGIIYFNPEIYYAGGITLPLLKNTFEFFVPLIYSKNLHFRTVKSPLGFYGFKLNLNNLHPQKIKKIVGLEKGLEIF